MVRVFRNVKQEYECVGVDLGWKKWWREAEKRMVFDSYCDP